MFSCLALMGLYDMNYNFENMSGDTLLSRRDHRYLVAKQTFEQVKTLYIKLILIA